MDVHTGLAPRYLRRAMIKQHFLIPEDDAAIERLWYYLDIAKPQMPEIKLAVCEFYGLQVQEIEQRCRAYEVTLARQVFCYLAHRYNRASLAQIGKQVGLINHSTVWHAIRKIEKKIITRPLLEDDIDLLRLRICEKLLLRPATRV